MSCKAFWAECNATRRWSASASLKPRTTAPAICRSMALRHEHTRSRCTCRTLPAGSDGVTPRISLSTFTTSSTVSAARRENACTDRARERSGSSGRRTDSHSASQPKPITAASTNQPTRPRVTCPPPVMYTVIAPISARLAARALHDRRANDANISRTRNPAVTQTPIRLRCTVATTAPEQARVAQPSVRSLSRGSGSGASSAPSNAAPAANRVMRNGSATSKATVTASIVAHASTVAHAARTPRRVRTAPGSITSRRAAIPPIIE